MPSPTWRRPSATPARLAPPNAGKPSWMPCRACSACWPASACAGARPRTTPTTTRTGPAAGPVRVVVGVVLGRAPAHAAAGQQAEHARHGIHEGFPAFGGASRAGVADGRRHVGEGIGAGVLDAELLHQ